MFTGPSSLPSASRRRVYSTPTAAILPFFAFLPGPRRTRGRSCRFCLRAWRPFASRSLCGRARRAYSALEIAGAALPSTITTSTSPSSSGGGACSRKPRARSPTASTMRRTARGLGVHSNRWRARSRAEAKAICAHSLAIVVTTSIVNLAGSPSSRCNGQSRAAYRLSSRMPSGCSSITLPNRVPTSAVSVPTTTRPCPSTLYERPVSHRAAWRAKKSVISARPRASSPLHRRRSASAAVLVPAAYAIVMSTRIACCTSVLAWSILVIGASSLGLVKPGNSIIPGRRGPVHPSGAAAPYVSRLITHAGRDLHPSEIADEDKGTYQQPATATELHVEGIEGPHLLSGLRNVMEKYG